MAFLKKVLIVICAIAIFTTCITISTKYIIHNRMENILNVVEGDEVEVSADVVNEINKLLKLTGKEDSYEECYLSAVVDSYNGDYKQAINKYENAIEYVESDDKKVDLYRKIGIIYNSLGEYGRAIQYLTLALDINPEDKNSLLYKAECYLQEQKYPLALQLIDQYTNHYDLSPEQYETVMTMYVTLGQYDKIIEKANDAIKKYSDLEETFVLYRLQANCLKDDLDAARADGQRYIDITGNETNIDVLVASYLYALTKYDKALELYLNCIYEQDMKNLFAQAIECSYQVDDYKTMLKLSSDALNYYEGDERIEYYKWKAIALMQENSFIEAINCFNEYIDNNPEHYEVVYLRGLCYFTIEAYKKAIDDFSLSINEEDLLEDSLYNRALCYVQTNDIDNTILDLQAIVELNSGSETYVSALELLNALSIEE